jgi:hypothetical protein
MANAAGRVGSALAVVVVVGLGLFWGAWRWFYAVGGPWPAGHSCSSVVACREGLCLIHARDKGGALVKASPKGDGYCSARCQADRDCPSDMACEPLPAGISRESGDHLPLIKLPERLCVRKQ